MAEPTCSRLRQMLLETTSAKSASKSRNLKLHVHPKGTYVCMEGPQFSTRAESLMHRTWGADLIGMTAMPEAKLAREAQMCYALIALASDYDCWKPHEGKKDKQTLLQEILGNLKAATDNCLRLIEAALGSGREFASESCPCRRSLDLAVWTDQNHVADVDKKELGVLFE
jgi:5'-methylthioadenosine phosphorylase